MAPSGEPSTWKALGELSSLGVAMVAATIIGLGGGYYADRWLGTSPWLTLFGLGFGIAAAFVILFRSAKAARGGGSVDGSDRAPADLPAAGCFRSRPLHVGRDADPHRRVVGGDPAREPRAARRAELRRGHPRAVHPDDRRRHRARGPSLPAVHRHARPLHPRQ